MRGRSTDVVSMVENSHFHATAALSPSEAPPLPFDIRLSGVQSGAVCFGDEKKICAFAGNQPLIPRPSSQFLNCNRTDLFRLRGITNGNPKILGHTEGPGEEAAESDSGLRAGCL